MPLSPSRILQPTRIVNAYYAYVRTGKWDGTTVSDWNSMLSVFQNHVDWNATGYVNRWSLSLTQPWCNRWWTGTYTNIAYYVLFRIYFPSSGTWVLQLGVDHGKGTAVTLDGNNIYFTSSGVWWNYNWNYAISVNMNITSGWHEIEVFGLENCCDGGNSYRLIGPDGKIYNLDVWTFQFGYPQTVRPWTSFPPLFKSPTRTLTPVR